MSPEEIALAAAAMLHTPVWNLERLGGGDLSAVFRLRLKDDRRVIAKIGADATTEAGMLTAIRAASAPAPRVLGVSSRLLLMEQIEDAAGLSANGWAGLGEALRGMHRQTGPGYGWPVDFAFGPVAICNAPLSDWPWFWTERRLLPEAPHLPRDAARRLDILARRLPDLLPARPTPGLLHGDLWSGNILARRDGRLSGLIDPACYHGHGEVDLAMLALFGAPGAEFQNSYGAPDPGAEDRRAIYQLWPAIVHVRLFGAGYQGMLDRLLTASGV